MKAKAFAFTNERIALTTFNLTFIRRDGTTVEAQADGMAEVKRRVEQIMNQTIYRIDSETRIFVGSAEYGLHEVTAQYVRIAG